MCAWNINQKFLETVLLVKSHNKIVCRLLAFTNVKCDFLEFKFYGYYKIR